MKKLNVLLAALFLLGLPLISSAMQGMDHGKHAKMMEGDMVMLGDQTEEGVKAMAHLKDVKAAMVKMGMPETHHFMVMFMDTATGKPIETGTVAVKIKSPKGDTGKAIELMGMDGHFGADVLLAEKGIYTFTLGTKVADEKKRQFEFTYELK